MSARSLFSSLLLAIPLSTYAALEPYVGSLESADGIAIVRVIAREQTFDGTSIRSNATLFIETPIAGVKKGETFKQSFGLPQKPAIRKNGSYSQTLVLAGEDFSFEIAQRYLVLLKKKKDGWSVARDSAILDDMICDGYFEAFAGSQDVSVSKAIELLRVHRKNIESNKSAKTTPDLHPSASDR